MKYGNKDGQYKQVKQTTEKCFLCGPAYVRYMVKSVNIFMKLLMHLEGVITSI